MKTAQMRRRRFLMDRARAFPFRDDCFFTHVATDRVARAEIQQRAYAIWEREGRPVNRTLDHWLEAEADLLRDR